MRHAQRSQSRRSAVSERVVERVAEAEGVSPEKLGPPLFDVVDPDALDQLFEHTPTSGRMNGRVIFTYCDHEVTVHGDGHVSVDGRE